MYLSVAGYTIHFVFLSTEWDDKKNVLIRLISRYFEGFIIKSPKIIHATIIFKEISGIPFINKNRKSYSIHFKNINKNTYETYYHTSIFELSQLLLIVIVTLLGNNGFLLHASGVVTNNGVVFFMGPSGAGKSTSLKMAMNHFLPFSDDCVIFRKLKNKFICYQAPWIEKDLNLIRVDSNNKKIKQLCVIKKNKEFKVVELTSVNLIKEMIKNVWTINGISKSTINCIASFTKTGIKGVALYLHLTDRDKLLSYLKN